MEATPAVKGQVKCAPLPKFFVEGDFIEYVLRLAAIQYKLDAQGMTVEHAQSSVQQDDDYAKMTLVLRFRRKSTGMQPAAEKLPAGVLESSDEQRLRQTISEGAFTPVTFDAGLQYIETKILK